MAYAWFLTVYKISPRKMWGRPVRYCAMDDFTPKIYAEKGSWSETEVLGNYAVVKVSASAPLLAEIATDNKYFYQFPVIALDDFLDVMNAQDIIDLQTRIVAMGYTDEEMTGNLGTRWNTLTLRQVLTFIANRRRKPRYDPVQDKIILDGDVVVCKPIEKVDSEVTTTGITK